MIFTPRNTGPNAQVLLNGVPVDGYFTRVDDEKGEATILVRDEFGKLVKDEDGNAKTEVLTGNYTVRDV